MKTETLYECEEVGTHGAFKLKIEVGATTLPDLTGPAIYNAAYDAAKLVKSAIMEAVVKNNPKAQKAKENERHELVGLFKEPVYVEEIPNGYCSDWCCKHLPWFIVTTKIGRIKIGWRKSVIVIDWDETINKKRADELFPNEDVTKGQYMIHAWSVEDARRYLQVIMAAANP